jgi:hypothetical protein
MERDFTIADDFDPDGDMPASADPMTDASSHVSKVRSMISNEHQSA